MSLRLKFNLSLLLLVMAALAVCWFTLYGMLKRNAVAEVREEAGLMMQSAIAVRTYTIEQIKPKLSPQLDTVFMPQTVPAFAATETFNELSKTYPEYRYKEATLNPTNPRDQADDWEAQIVEGFAAPGSPDELSGMRDTLRGPRLYVARPIRIDNRACLACHDTPQLAPASLLRIYGPDHGFGWQQGQVIGAQIVTVPLALPLARARQAFYGFVGVLIGVFAALALLVNWMLRRFVIAPMLHIAEHADGISSGRLELEPLAESGNDEIAVLARAFNRLAISLRKAMDLLGDPPT